MSYTYEIQAGAGVFNWQGNDATLSINPALQFAEGGKLLQPVVAFLGALAGLTAVFDANTYPDFPKDPRGRITGVARGETRIDLGQVVARVRGEAIAPDELEANLCCMLALTVWESLDLKSSDHFKINNEVPFLLLYHLRNAAAHGNEWTFKNGQPKVAFQWRHITIDPAKPMPEGRQCFGNDVKSSDLLLLLVDVDELLHPGAPKLVIEDGNQIRTATGSVASGIEVALKSKQ